MKYNEFMHINEDFIPVFDLENEEADQYWSLFIPNDKFRDILSSAIDSLNPTNQKNPVWLQGTYGTGKTHATSVIKHLLCDETLPEYDLEDNQLTAKLNNFRNKNKVLPVVLKGTSSIGDSRRFTFTIQNAVKKALNERNMRVAVPSEFENMISILEEYPLKEEDIVGTKLEAFPSEEILLRLKNEETAILIEVEDILMNKGIATVTQDNIVDWLVNVRNKLKQDYDIDYIMIFWDEFTGALNMLNVEDILLQIQNIAEAKHKGLSLFIVSHRTRSTQVNINQEIINKIMNRFERKFYSMESVATYQLMEKSIDKDEKWEGVKNKYVDVITPLINKISDSDGPKVKKALENLYPIHPYTSYLATFIAQEIGSTERSIFKFLHDDIDYGFRSFINTFDITERYFLTADYLWEFFYDDFEQSEDEKINSSIKKYKLHYDSLKQMDEAYLVIFKAILLLNVLYKIAEVGKGSLAIPSEKNITNVFIGSIYQDKVSTVLDYIDKQNIINKTPDGLFELTTNTLPAEQVNKEIEKLRKNIKINDLFSNKNLRDIQNDFDKKIIREIELEIRDANTPENRFISDLEKGIFKNSGYLHMFLFLCKTNEEFIAINKIIKSVQSKNLLTNTIVVVSEAVLGEDNFNKYLEFRARSIVAKAHNYDEDVELNKKHAEKYIDAWVKDIKRKTVSWYLNEDEGKLPLANFIDKVNTNLSKKIFYYGLENISQTLKNRNLWPHQLSKIQAERYILANNREELDNSLNGLDSKSVCVLMELNNENSIVNDSNLQLKKGVAQNHPIAVIQEFIDETFEKAQNKGKFNLGIELKPLIEAPYGLYPNKLNIAAFSFCLRKYVGRLYDDKGNAIDKTRMKNKIIGIFEYWVKGKGEHELYVRYGSENEKKLAELINNTFELGLDSNNQSISTVRWELRKWIKDNKTPLWLLKYSYINEKNQSLSESIDALFDFLKPNDGNLPDYIIQNCYEKINPTNADLKWSAKETSDVLFSRFIDELDVDLTSEDIEEVKKHIDVNMPEEVYDWDENKVESEVYKWIHNKGIQGPDLKDPNMECSSNGTTITVTLNKNATGDILVEVSGNGHFGKIRDGIAKINIPGLEEGLSYVATVTYKGDDNFTESKAYVKIEVPKIEIELNNPNLNAKVEGNIITVSIDEDATGDILVNVDGKGYFAKIRNGIAVIEVVGLEEGKTYTASVSYKGDDNFEDAEIKVDMTIPITPVELKDCNLKAIVDGTIITVSIDEDATGEVLVNVDGKGYFAKISNGNAIIDVSGLDDGKTYSASVSYNGDDNFDKAETTVKIVIPEKPKPTDDSISKLEEIDADLLKNALIQALRNSEEITPEIIVDYLELINDGNS